jgi:hypothetical protein
VERKLECRILLRKSTFKERYGEGNITIELRKTLYEGGRWVQLAQDPSPGLVCYAAL